MDNFGTKILELSQDVYVIPAATNVGVILNNTDSETEVYLVDTGSTEIEGDYILEVLESFFNYQNKKYKIKAILTTHGHADHCGAHQYIKNITGCKILASRDEQVNMETPIAQPVGLWGAYPPHELRTLYFKSEQVFIDQYLNEDTVIELSDGRTLTFLELHGHSYFEIAIIVNNNKDKIIFAGDSIFPRNELGKHWLPLIGNPIEFMEALDKLNSIENVEWCIPSHGDFLHRNLKETVELNKIAIISNRMCILESLKDKELHSLDDIIQYVANKNELTMTFGQYALISSTIKSFISAMHDAKEIKFKMENNRLFFYVN